MACGDDHIGYGPLKVDPLTSVLRDVQGQLEDKERLELLFLVNKQIGDSCHTKLRSELQKSDNEMGFMDIFQTLKTKLGTKYKAVEVLINVFKETKLRVTFGSNIGKPIYEVLTQALKECVKVDRETGQSEIEHIIGREEDMRIVMEWLLSPNVLAASICGMPGIGKTSLAMKVWFAMRHEECYDVHVIHLSGESHIDRFFTSILEKLDIFPGEATETDVLKQLLISELWKLKESKFHMETLFVLDDVDGFCQCEKMAGFLDHLSYILRSLANLKIKFMITSTNKFLTDNKGQDVTFSHRKFFGGLLCELELGKLPVEHCVIILEKEIHSTYKGVLVSTAELQELAVLCGQNPYLVTLVGSRLRAGVNEPRSLIKSLRRNISETVFEVDNLIAETFDNLTYRYQVMMCRLCVFDSRFPLEAACAVLEVEPERPNTTKTTLDVLEHLRNLRAKHLLELDVSHHVKDSDASKTSHLKSYTVYVPSIIRTYIQGISKTERFQRDEVSAKCLHKLFFQRLVEQMANQTYPYAMAQMFSNHGCICAALLDLSSAYLGDISDKEQFLSSLRMFCFLAQPTIFRKDEDRLLLFGRFLERAQALKEPLWCILSKLFIAQLHYDYIDSVNGHKQSEKILQEIEPELKEIEMNYPMSLDSPGTKRTGPLLLHGYYCLVKGQVLECQEKYSDECKFLKKGLRIFQKYSNKDLVIVRFYNQLGLAAKSQGMLDKAKEYYDAAYKAIVKSLGDVNHPLKATVLSNYGAIYHRLARQQKGNDACREDLFNCASKFYTEASKTFKSLYMMHTSRSLSLLNNLSRLHLEQRQYGEALFPALDAREVAMTFRRSDPIAQIHALLSLAHVYQKVAAMNKRQGNIFMEYYKKAEQEYETVLEICQEKRLVAEDVGKGDELKSRYWSMLCDYPEMLKKRLNKQSKSSKVFDMIQRLEEGCPLVGSDDSSSADLSDSGESTSDHHLSGADEIMGDNNVKLGHIKLDSVEDNSPLMNHGACPKRGKEEQDSANEALPLKVPRLDYGVDNDPSLDSVSSTEDRKDQQMAG